MTTFTITEQHVKDGIFAGAVRVNEAGRTHAVTISGTLGGRRRSPCGFGVDHVTGSYRERDEPVGYLPLPSEVDCLLCVRKCHELVEQREVQTALFEAAKPEPERTGWDMTPEEITELRIKLEQVIDERDKYLKALEEGIAEWRRQRGSMGRKISTLERKEGELQNQLHAARSAAAVPAVPADKESLQRNLTAWKNLSGALLWQLGGAGTDTKTCIMSPLEWASAAAGVIDVKFTTKPDGAVEITARLLPPKDPRP